MNGPFILKHNLLLAMFYILKNPIAVLILIVLSTFLDSSKARTVLKVESLLKLHKIIILIPLFSKTAPRILMKLCMQLGYGCPKDLVIVAGLVIARFKRKAAGGRLSFEQGYNQTCHYFHNLQTDKPNLHAKFHQNPWCGFREKW